MILIIYLKNTKSEVVDKRNNISTQNTNLVYFTTACNLGCTYCFEQLDNIKPKHIPIQELYKIADRVIEAEDPNLQTHFVLYGGEATLRWKEAELFMEYAHSKKNNVTFNLITNGILFLDDEFFKNFFSNKYYNNGMLSIDISFDGDKGNVERVYKDGGSSTEDVIMVFSKLKVYNLRWRLRYTIHKKNIDTFVYDIKKLIKHFKPERVIKNVVYHELDENDLSMLEKGFEELKKNWDNKKDTPICDLVCDTCDGCSMTFENYANHTPVGTSVHPKQQAKIYDTLDKLKYK